MQVVLEYYLSFEVAQGQLNGTYVHLYRRTLRHWLAVAAPVALSMVLRGLGFAVRSGFHQPPPASLCLKTNWQI